MRSIAFLSLVVVFLPAISFGQLPSSRCDSIQSTLEDCTFSTGIEPAQTAVPDGSAASAANLLDHSAVPVERSKAATLSPTDNYLNAISVVAPEPPRKQGFHWRRALFESFVFFSIEQAYVVKDDFRWVTIEKGIPFNQLAGGAVFTASNLPPGDTSSFNFTARGGGGIYIFTQHRQSLDVGCRWWHVSNGNLGIRNPEFNGLQLSLAYHWFK